MFNFRLNGLQITMTLTFEIFGSARNHGKKFLKLCHTSFSGIVHSSTRCGTILCFTEVGTVLTSTDDYAKDGGPGVV